MLEFVDADPAGRFTVEVIDEKVTVGSCQLPLGELISLSIHARDLVGGDKMVRWKLQSGKDSSKSKGEVLLSVLWLPAPPKPKPQPVQQQMGLNAGPPLQMQQTSTQIVHTPSQQQLYPQQPPMQPMQPMQPHFQPQPMQPMQPGYGAPAPQGYYAPQPMMAPPPGQLMYSPPPQPIAYAPQPYTQPIAYAPQPQLSAQPFYPGQQPLSAPVMPMAAAPAWTPASSSDDGVFPFSELKITRLIGDGTFGTVSAGEFRATPVAIKQLKQSVFSQAQWSEFMSEVKFLREARHPNIVLFSQLKGTRHNKAHRDNRLCLPY
jgi:hypothetical protein